VSDPALFSALTDLLRSYADEMTVKHDTDTSFYLEEDRSTGTPQMFAAVLVKKSYVSFHLYPVYLLPELLDGISPVLRKRMQGKSCFNFSQIKQVPGDELSALVKAAYETVHKPV
jgi:hypothetical protein